MLNVPDCSIKKTLDVVWSIFNRMGLEGKHTLFSSFCYFTKKFNTKKMWKFSSPNSKDYCCFTILCPISSPQISYSTIFFKQVIKPMFAKAFVPKQWPVAHTCFTSTSFGAFGNISVCTIRDITLQFTWHLSVDWLILFSVLTYALLTLKCLIMNGSLLKRSCSPLLPFQR